MIVRVYFICDRIASNPLTLEEFYGHELFSSIEMYDQVISVVYKAGRPWPNKRARHIRESWAMRVIGYVVMRYDRYNEEHLTPRMLIRNASIWRTFRMRVVIPLGGSLIRTHWLPRLFNNTAGKKIVESEYTWLK